MEKHYRFDPPVKKRQRGTTWPRIMSRTIIFECLQCGVTINCGSANTTKGIKLMDQYKQEHDALHEKQKLDGNENTLSAIVNRILPVDEEADRLAAEYLGSRGKSQSRPLKKKRDETASGLTSSSCRGKILPI